MILLWVLWLLVGFWVFLGVAATVAHNWAWVLVAAALAVQNVIQIRLLQTLERPHE